MRGGTPDGHPFNIMPLFQLTRLMRGVTRLTFDAQIINNISTHTPHARRDGDYVEFFDFYVNFNSHASCEA